MSWKDKLSMHLQDEENGHNAYMELANEAEKEGFCHEAGVLRDIAREEHTHHELLREMM